MLASTVPSTSNVQALTLSLEQFYPVGSSDPCSSGPVGTQRQRWDLVPSELKLPLSFVVEPEGRGDLFPTRFLVSGPSAQ